LENIGGITLSQLNRFINATEFPAYTRQFYAIAVICSGLVDGELATLVPANIPAHCGVIVMSIPNLQNTYTSVYEAVQESVVTPGAVPDAIV
jgi:hypothetical protein